MDIITTIIVAALGSTALSSLVIFLITRHDNQKNFGEKLKTLEKDTLRTQLLLMILLRPGEKTEILTIGEHYFKQLKGNWYMTPIFNKWCQQQKVEPEWLER